MRHIPLDISARIQAGLYPPCRHCDGQGVVYIPDPNGDYGYDDPDCHYCSGTGSRLTPEDQHAIYLHNLKGKHHAVADEEADWEAAVADPADCWAA